MIDFLGIFLCIVLVGGVGMGALVGVPVAVFCHLNVLAALLSLVAVIFCGGVVLLARRQKK